MTKQCDAKQQRLLSDLEKCEKTVDLIFQDHDIPPRVLGEWLRSRPFKRALEDMRGRMVFRLDQELFRGAVLGSARLATAVDRTGGFGKSVEMNACVNAIKLFNAMVRSPQLKRDAATAAARAARQREEAGMPPGYHPMHTPERAAALLARIRKEEERDARLDRDQDEDGKWMPAD